MHILDSYVAYNFNSPHDQRHITFLSNFGQFENALSPSAENEKSEMTKTEKGRVTMPDDKTRFEN